MQQRRIQADCQISRSLAIRMATGQVTHKKSQEVPIYARDEDDKLQLQCILCKVNFQDGIMDVPLGRMH